MGIESGLTNLLASGQNQQQPDLLRNYVGGMQIQQNNQNQQFRNNLLDRQFQMDERKFNRMEQQDQLEIDQNAKTDEAFGALMESWVPDNPKEERQKQSVMALYPSDKSGAFNHVFEQMKDLDPNIDPNDVVEMEGGGWALLQRNGPALPLSPPEGMQFAQKEANAPWFSGNIGGNQFSMGQGAMPQGMGQAQAAPLPKENTLTNPRPDIRSSLVAPKASPDHALMVDSAMGMYEQVLPGSPTAYDRATEEEKAAGVKQRTLNNADSAIGQIDKIMSEISNWNTGYGHMGLSWNETSDAAEMDGRLRPLKTKILLGAMAEAREGSKAGATGFGAMNEKEFQALEESVAALNPRSKLFWEDLNKVKYHFGRISSAMNGVDPGKWSPEAYQDAPTHEEYLSRKDQGLDPAQPSNPIGTEKPKKRYTYEAGKGLIEVK